MRKTFVAPVLKAESSLTTLTLGLSAISLRR